MAKIPVVVFHAKELSRADDAVFHLARAVLHARAAARHLHTLGQYAGEIAAIDAARSAEKALSSAREARGERRRALRRLGVRLCKCGTPLSDEPCVHCGGKKRQSCLLCHGTGKRGIRTGRH